MENVNVYMDINGLIKFVYRNHLVNAELVNISMDLHVYVLMVISEFQIIYVNYQTINT